MLMLYAATQPKSLETVISKNYFTEGQPTPIQISKHGDIFVVKHGKVTIYLSDGSSFDFEENSRITETFAASLQNPTKTFDLMQYTIGMEDTIGIPLRPDSPNPHLQFSQCPLPKFKMIKVSSYGKKLGCFFVCSSIRERSILKSIIRDCELVEVGGGSGDVYWTIVKTIN